MLLQARKQQEQCEKSFKQFKILLKKGNSVPLTPPVCTVCPIQIAHRVHKNVISKMPIIYTTEADVGA